MMKKFAEWFAGIACICVIGAGVWQLESCSQADAQSGGGFPSRPTFQAALVTQTGCAPLVLPQGGMNVCRNYFLADQVQAFSYGANFGGAGSCSLTGQTSASLPVTGCTRNSAGNYTLTFAANTFHSYSSYIVCTASSGTAAEPIALIVSITSSSVTVGTYTIGLVATDIPAGADSVICTG
jgi:hypothetical protein